MACDNPDCHCEDCTCDPCMCTEDKPLVVKWKREEEWKQKEWQQLDVLEGII